MVVSQKEDSFSRRRWLILPENIEEIMSKYTESTNEKDKEWEKELVRIIIEKLSIIVGIPSQNVGE